MTTINHPSHHIAGPLATTEISEPSGLDAADMRQDLLRIRLLGTSMTIQDAWVALNHHVRLLSDDLDAARAQTKEMAEVALALWSAGIEYVQTEPGFPCKHEGWLCILNPDLGAKNYDAIDGWVIGYDTVITHMLDD